MNFSEDDKFLMPLSLFMLLKDNFKFTRQVPHRKEVCEMFLSTKINPSCGVTF